MTTVESNGYTPATTYGGSTVFNGMKFHTHSDLPAGTTFTACSKNSNASNANAPQLRASDGTTVLATGSAWSSNSSSFTPYTLSANTDYYIGMVGDGSSSSFTWQNVQSFPVSGTYIDWTASIGTFATTYPVTIQSITLETPVSATTSPSRQNMTMSQFAPTVFASAIVTPDALTMNMTLYAPSVRVADRSHITVGSGSVGSKYIRTKWPVEEGLEAGTTKHSVDKIW